LFQGPFFKSAQAEEWMLKQVQHDGKPHEWDALLHELAAP